MKNELLAALFFIFSVALFAQNTDSLNQNIAVKTVSLKDSLSGSSKGKILKNALPTLLYQLALNFDLARGNQNYANFLPQLGLRAENKLVGISSNMLYNFARLNGKNLNSDLISRNTARLLPKSKTPIQLLAGGETSKLRNLPGRTQTGLGIGFNLIKKENNTLRLGINGVYDRSKYNGTNFVNDAAETTNVRKVFGPLLQLSGQHQIKNGLAFLTYDIYNLIALNKKKDYRVNYIGSLVIPVFKNLNVRSSMIYSYENVILKDTKHADLYWTFGFGVGQF